MKKIIIACTIFTIVCLATIFSVEATTNSTGNAVGRDIINQNRNQEKLQVNKEKEMNSFESEVTSSDVINPESTINSTNAYTIQCLYGDVQCNGNHQQDGCSSSNHHENLKHHQNSSGNSGHW